MKKKILLLICCTVITVVCLAQTTQKTETIKVYGNCNMCKTTIEGSLKKKDGIMSKKWNSETKILTVTYDTLKITKQQIGKKVSEVGYDNEYATASDAKYNSLHHCCQYDRPKKN